MPCGEMEVDGAAREPQKNAWRGDGGHNDAVASEGTVEPRRCETEAGCPGRESESVGQLARGGSRFEPGGGDTDTARTRTVGTVEEQPPTQRLAPRD